MFNKAAGRHRWLPTPVILGLGAALVIFMTGLVSWTLYDAHKSIQLNAEKDTANLAISLQREIERAISSLDLSIQAAVRGMETPGVAGMEPKFRQAFLFDGAIGANTEDGVVIADEAGWIIYDSLQVGFRPVDISDRAYFQAQRDHPGPGLQISQPLHNRRTGAWSIMLSRRIDRPDGSFAGLVIAGLPLSFFQSLFSGLAIGEHGVVTLTNTLRHQLITRRPYSEQDIGRNLVDTDSTRQSATLSAGTVETTSQVDAVTRIYSFRAVDHLGLSIVVGLATEDVFAEWQKKATLIGGVLTVLSAAVLGLIWALTKELQRRSRAEQAAREAACLAETNSVQLGNALARLDALFRNSGDQMAIASPGPDGEFVYEAVNPVWENVTGIPAHIALGKKPTELFSGKVADTVLAAWQACITERRRVHTTFNWDKSPNPDWDALYVPIQNERGNVERLIAVSRSVTERNRLEGDLRQAQKMEVIGRLAAGVSHDFNNILQAISGGIELLKGETALSLEARDYLDMIEQASHRGSYLTHHLLSYARRQMLNPKLLDLREIVCNLKIILERTLGTDIVLTVEIEEAIGHVRADRAQLETALMNLAINASHAMPNGGSLQIKVGRAEHEVLAGLHPGRYLVIAMTDTGTGMPADVLACIFDPFFTTKGLNGTGLGLAMVQGFCRQSGGDVRATSEMGEGTRFEIWLPEVAGEVRTDPTNHQTTSIYDGCVLLVDDAEDVLMTVSAFLRTGGLTVHSASGGKQALSVLAAGERFDLLITDYMMPSMKGPELVKQARAFQPDLPALVISGYADVGDFLDDLPAAKLLLKPFRRAHLIAEAGALIEQARRGAGAHDEDRTCAVIH